MTEANTPGRFWLGPALGLGAAFLVWSFMQASRQFPWLFRTALGLTTFLGMVAIGATISGLVAGEVCGESLSDSEYAACVDGVADRSQIPDALFGFSSAPLPWLLAVLGWRPREPDEGWSPTRMRGFGIVLATTAAGGLFWSQMPYWIGHRFLGGPMFESFGVQVPSWTSLLFPLYGAFLLAGIAISMACTARILLARGPNRPQSSGVYGNVGMQVGRFVAGVSVLVAALLLPAGIGVMKHCESDLHGEPYIEGHCPAGAEIATLSTILLSVAWIVIVVNFVHGWARSRWPTDQSQRVALAGAHVVLAMILLGAALWHGLWAFGDVRAWWAIWPEEVQGSTWILGAGLWVWWLSFVAAVLVSGWALSRGLSSQGQPISH